MASTLGQDNPFRYRGYYYDTETELYYLNARYYNPEWCRFISPDPVLDTSSAVGCNFFAYCRNDPVNLIDLNGMFAKTTLKGGLFVEISANPRDLQRLWFYLIFGEIAMVWVMFILSWDIVAVCIFSVCAILFCYNAYAEWRYFSKKIILEEDGCSFVSARGTKKYAWEEIRLQYEDNSFCLFRDEFPGGGLIISGKPISKPKYIGSQMYCRIAHPTTGVFIRFKSSFDDPKNELRYLNYAYGFVVEKDQIMGFLNSVGKTER